MKTRTFNSVRSLAGASGMTLMEVLIAVTIAVLAVTGIINGYIFSTRRAEWSAQSLAAHSMAIQRLEQTRAAKWNVSDSPVTDEVVEANFPTITAMLDMPMSGSNVVNATIRTRISTVSADPPLKLVEVDCIWPFMNRGFFTNTLRTYRAPAL